MELRNKENMTSSRLQNNICRPIILGYYSLHVFIVASSSTKKKNSQLLPDPPKVKNDI